MPSRTITNSAETLIPQGAYRKSFVVQNEDGAINCFIKQENGETLACSTIVHDHRLTPGGGIALNYGTDGERAIQGRWTIIAASGTPRISIFETEDIRR